MIDRSSADPVNHMHIRNDPELERAFLEASRHFSIVVRTAVPHDRIGYIPVLIDDLDGTSCAFFSMECFDHESQVLASKTLLAEGIYTTFLAPCYYSFDEVEFQYLLESHGIIGPPKLWPGWPG